MRRTEPLATPRRRRSNSVGTWCRIRKSSGTFGKVTCRSAASDSSRCWPQINAGATAFSRQAEARIARAVYSARLDGDQLIDGQARLELTRSSDQTAALILAPCGLALGRPQWEDDASAAANVGSDPLGNTVVLVDRASTAALRLVAQGPTR